MSTSITAVLAKFAQGEGDSCQTAAFCPLVQQVYWTTQRQCTHRAGNSKTLSLALHTRRQRSVRPHHPPFHDKPELRPPAPAPGHPASQQRSDQRGASAAWWGQRSTGYRQGASFPGCAATPPSRTRRCHAGKRGGRRATPLRSCSRSQLRCRARWWGRCSRLERGRLPSSRLR